MRALAITVGAMFTVSKLEVEINLTLISRHSRNVRATVPMFCGNAHALLKHHGKSNSRLV